MRLIHKIPDWNRLVERSAAEFISPIIYYRLKELGLEEKIPTPLAHALQKLYILNRDRNLMILAEAKRVMGQLRENGIDYICLKGLALAETVYPQFVLRRMSDVDMLFPKNQIAGVDHTLQTVGYEPVDGTAAEALRNPAGYLSSLEYRKKNSKQFLAFHVHWHPVNTTVPATVLTEKIDLDRIWKKSIEARIADAACRILCPPHQVIFLCEHALRAGHSFDRLILIYDIQQVIRHYGETMDWEELISDARAFGLSPLVFSGLSVVSHYTAGTVPERVVNRLKPTPVSAWVKIFLAFQYRNFRIRGSSMLVHLSMHRGIISKLVFIFRIFFPPAAVISHKHYADGNSRLRRYLSRLSEIISHLRSVRMHFGKNR